MISALLTGCAPAPVEIDRAFCPVPAALRTEHAAALIADGGPRSQRTGAALIAAIDAVDESSSR